MKKVLLTLVSLIVVFVVVVLFLASRQSNTYHVERTATVAASPAAVYALVNDFQKWPQWSPWERLDPTMKRDIGTPSAGVGATYSWVGNAKVGEGKMTILESVPDSKVRLKLDFIKPMTETCDIRFNLEPSGSGTAVNWAMDGNKNMMSKVMCVFISMDKMVGPDFDRGLGSLKTLAESAPAAAAATDSTAAKK